VNEQHVVSAAPYEFRMEPSAQVCLETDVELVRRNVSSIPGGLLEAFLAARFSFSVIAGVFFGSRLLLRFFGMLFAPDIY
jgi:hypothetical protein